MDAARAGGYEWAVVSDPPPNPARRTAMPNVLIGPSHLRGHAARFREILTEAGFQTIDLEAGPALDEAELRQYLPETDALLCGGEVMTRHMFAVAPRLRVVARVGVGYDLVDLTAATRHNVPVTITPGTNQGSVAEQTFALLLALKRNLVINDQDVHSGGWNRPLPLPLRGLTMGLVGLGRIGRAVASRARAFEMELLACDDICDDAFDKSYGIKRVGFEELLERSDVVSLHCPLMGSTRGMINASTLSKMKPGAVLINTARGGLVVEADLRDALVSGRLAGAGLDVLNHEPPEPGNPLLGLKTVVFSPHIGGIDTKGMDDMATMAAQTIVDLYRGKMPASGVIVNSEVASGWSW